MARPLKIELADGYYYLMNRGNNRQDIYYQIGCISPWFIENAYFGNSSLAVSKKWHPEA